MKEKILSMSNSYKYYKQKNKELLDENERLKKELESLKNKNETVNEELKFIKSENKTIIEELKSKSKQTLREKYREENAGHLGFCRYDYVNYFLDDDFEDKLKETTKHLDSDSKYYYKWLYLRNMVTGVVTRDTLYSKLELSQQKQYRDFKAKYTSKDEVAGYKFTGKYNLHPFVDLNLDDEDKEFLKNKDIIDAGAFTGDTSIPMAKITTKNIYAFEPFEESFNLLSKNIADNNIDNIIPVRKSLGNREGEQTLYLSGNNVQGITSNPNTRKYDTEIKIHETTIDKFVEENDLDVGFITVDVEGAEMDLLNGALNTIKTQKPILSISIYHQLSDFFEIIPWIADLDLGYEFKIEKENPWFFFGDISVQCRVKDR